MFKIAVCDDDVRELSLLVNLITRYQDEKKAALKYTPFTNALDLLETLRGSTYDILLLDVLMPGLNGMEAAREIRTFDAAMKIIFLTTSPEFAVESYAVDAYYYLLKPVTPEKLFPVLDKLWLEAQKAETALLIKSASGLTRIPFHTLEFLEVLNKKLYFHLTNGNVKAISGSLADFETELLNREEFIKVHRSCIVNMACIRELSAGGLTTCARQSVPVSRLLYRQVREAYMRYLFVEEGFR